MPNSFHKRTTILAKSTILISSILIFGSILSVAIATDAYADATDTISGTINLTCTMTSEVTQAHTASISNTVNTPNIGNTNISVTCNDTGGFGIFAIGYSNDTDGTTSMISSAGSDYNIATGTATSGDTSNWSMKVTPGTGLTTANSFNAYHVVPANYTKVAEKASGIQLSSSVAATTTYQVYPSNSQPAGTYTGKVKYTLVHPSTESCPEGYELKSGVCEKKTTLSTITNMQEMTSAICTASALNETKQLKDTRDNKLYWVTKLADNNCWMTQNLDFDIDSTKTYTSADTNLSSNWTPSTSTYTTGTSTWNISTTTPESYDPGNLCWNGNLNYDWDGTLDTETVPCTSSNMNYHIGNYYNWTAAVAMNDSSDYEDDETLVSQSICPAGWTLPTGGYDRTGSGSFINLVTQYGWDSDEYMMTGSYQMWSAPLSFVLGGSWGGSSFNVASDGFYWSSVVGGSLDAYYLYFRSDGGVEPQYYDYRNDGFSVRCVAVP